MKSEPLIELIRVNVEFAKRRVLDQIDLEIAASEIVTLIGPNGAGKSTLVKVILGLIPPSHGQVLRHANLNIGYVPQNLQFDHTMPLKVERLLSIAARAPKSEIASALAIANATHLHQLFVQDLSGGELQRVLLARALLRNPQLLVLDEPVQGVDMTGQTELYNLISQIRDTQNCAILMVSHDLHLVMAQTDRVICLNRHICCSGHPAQVSNDPAYRELFGIRGGEGEGLAVYMHHHDHSHDEQGNIVPDAHPNG